MTLCNAPRESIDVGNLEHDEWARPAFFAVEPIEDSPYDGPLPWLVKKMEE